MFSLTRISRLTLPIKRQSFGYSGASLTGPSTLVKWISWHERWGNGVAGRTVATTGLTGGLTHYQSNHISVTLICSTVQCTLGRSMDKDSYYSQASWLYNREDLESLLLTVLGSLTINGFPWEWCEFPQNRSYHIHCTKDMDSLPVMGSVTSRARTLQAVGTIGGTILGAQYRTGVSCFLNWKHWGIPSRNCVLLIETT